MINEAFITNATYVGGIILVSGFVVLAAYLVFRHFRDNGDSGGSAGSGGTSNIPSDPSFSGVLDLPPAGGGGSGSGNPFSWIIDFFLPKRLEPCCEVAQFKAFCVNENSVSLWDFFFSFCWDPLVLWSQHTAVLLCSIV